MNNDYDTYIVQKYRLAVAIAVIRNTPEKCTPKTYLERLRNYIKTDMEPYDSDMTVCEDDFNFNDDTEQCNNENKNDDLNANNETQIFDSQANDSITILKDFDFNDMIRNTNNDKDMIENNSVSNVLKMLKDVDSGKMADAEVSCVNDDNDKTPATYYECSGSLLRETDFLMNENMDQVTQNSTELSFSTHKVTQCDSNHDINKTINRSKAEICSVENATFYDLQKSNTFHDYTNNFTHVSQSQVNDIVLPRYFIEGEKTKDFKSNVPADQIEQYLNAVISETHENDISGSNKIFNPILGKPATEVVIVDDVKIINESKKHKIVSQDRNNIHSKQIKRARNVDNNINKTTDIEEIKNNLNMNATGATKYNLQTGPSEPFSNLFKFDDEVNDSLHLSDKLHTDFNKGSTDSQNNTSDCLDNFASQISVESDNKSHRIAYNSQPFSQFSQEFDSEPSNNKIKTVDMTLNSIKQNTTEEEKGESEEEQIIEDLFEKLSDSQAEVVPFKVLEELNKVKLFLDKRNRKGSSECVPDSGYKSDSQSRSSLKSAMQSSNVWLNQSAHCLLSYISRCPLAVNTEEITNEISRTLGRLIDRLHEDEKYPSFLEEHLQTVDELLKEIYEEESADKLLQKDENMHRLFLLNKSSHIMKYTTEKIIAILEDILTILATEELLEVSRTVLTENLSYIFHILETLIKKLLVYKSLSQQSTQNSQEEEMVLKKSSITDIWRKKWNPDQKCVSDTISVKPCVLLRCSEVLNKVIVQAMDGYSLISYFALQCFNLLQN